MNDFAIVERPQYLKDVLGNKGITSKLKTMLEANSLPHTMMFVGPSGCGKSSLCNVVINELGVDSVNTHYVDCGLYATIDSIRDLAEEVQLSPLGGFEERKIYVLEECHKLGSNKKAQEGLLYMLENLPDFCYVIASTTNPEMLLPTLLSRFEPLMKVAPLTKDETMYELIKPTCIKYGFAVRKDIAEQIYIESNGCPRIALRLLYSIKDVPVDEQKIEEKDVYKENEEMLDIYKELVFFKGNIDQTYLSIINKLETISADWEGHRQALLAIAGNYTMRRGKNSKELRNAAYLVKTFELPVQQFANFASNLYIYLQTIA